MRLRPKVKILKDFFVFDVETGVDAPFCDIETRKEYQNAIQWILEGRPERFKFGVIYGYNYTKVVYSLQELIETFLEPRFKNKKVFAHNAIYDLDTTFGCVFKMLKDVIFNGSRFIMGTNGNCIFCDSMNIFVGQSVKKIGAQLGMNKQELGDNLFSPDGITEKEINYCIRDCQIVWDALIRSFEFAGDIKVTQASLSMTYFRRHHQEFNIDHNENVKFFWDSYFGGRCEAFKIGETIASVYDVKSMYPDRMRNETFPNPKYLKEVSIISTNQFINQILPEYEGCIYAEVYHHYNKFGLLPIRKENKLLFPIGNINGCWNFNEFGFALSTGLIEIKKIHRVIFAEKMLSPFIGYIDTLYDLKNKAEIDNDLFTRDLVKRYMNSLYGKFCQRIEEESIYLENIEKQLFIIQEAQRKGIFKKLLLFNANRLDAFLITGNTQAKNISYSIPSFGSYITSAARVKIAKKLFACKNNKVVYCDTDSVFVQNDFGMEDENYLGGWCKEPDKIVYQINGLKNYKYVTEDGLFQKLKGVPSSAIKVDVNDYKYFNLVKSKEGLRRNMDAGILIKRTKHITNNYTKRIVLPGGETEPLIL